MDTSFCAIHQKGMEKMKKMKIIAVDTSMGTNFLLSACEDATMSELRGLIQKGHMSCFPEHESINVGALTVEYSQKQYHVTDALLIGQVFRKHWNKIHAEVSLGSLRSKHIELESCADAKTGRLGAALDDGTMATHPEALLNAMGVDKQPLSDEAPALGSSALLCRAKVLDNCIGTAPTRIGNEENFRCPMLSIESPYTQPCSELNAVTRAVFGRRAFETKRTCNRWYTREDGIIVKKQKRLELDCQISCKSDSDKDLGPHNIYSSPNNINSSSTEEDLKADKHEAALESFQQYKQDTDCRDGFSKRAALTDGDEHLTNAYEVPNNDNLQQDFGSLDSCIAKGGTMREQNEISLPVNTQVFVPSPRKTKFPSVVFKSHHEPLERATEEVRSCRAETRISESSLNEKEYANLERRKEEPASQTSEKTGTKECPRMSARNQEEEAYLNDGARIYQTDLSRGYPVQLNNHSILLVGSVSADVVLETQESQMEPQDGIKPGGEEEIAHTNGGLEALEQGAVETHQGCLRHERHPELVDPVEPQEMEAQDARNMNTKELSNQIKELEATVDKEENSKLKPPEVADEPSKGLSPEENTVITEARKLCAGHFDNEKQLPDASLPGANDTISLYGKKKKRRRRKVSEIHKVITQEDGRFVNLDNAQQDVQGGVDPEKTINEDARFKQSLIEVMNGRPCNQGKVEESSHDLEIQAQNDMGNSGNASVGSEDLGSPRNETKKRKISRRGNASNCRKRQKNSVLGGAASSAEGDKCNESTSFSDKNIEKVSIRSSFGPEIGEECMEDGSIGGHNTVDPEYLCGKEEAEKDLDTIRRKKMKLRKEPSTPVSDHDDGAGINKISNCESARLNRFVNNYNENEFRPSIKGNKELSDELLEQEELRRDNNLDANVDDEEAMKMKSKRKMKLNTDADDNICFLQEQDHNIMTALHADGGVLHADVDDTESLLKDGLFTSSSTVSSSKEGLVTTNQAFDVFEFEGSETVHRQKENLSTSNAETDNLDKLCSIAVKFVEDDTLNPSMVTTRKTGRKAVHPKRWITVLSERLTWNQATKSGSKKKRANKKSRLSTKGTCPVEMPSDDDFNAEASHMEEEGKDGKIACPEGCGRRYTKKTSAYYRHRRRCSG